MSGHRDPGPGPSTDGEGDEVDDPVDGPAPAGGSRVVDVGLQHERTALAWDRTALSLLVVGALLLRGVGPPFDDLRHVPGHLTLAVGAALLWASARRYRRRNARLRAGASVVWPRLVRLTGVAAVGAGLAALAVIVG